MPVLRSRRMIDGVVIKPRFYHEAMSEPWQGTSLPVDAVRQLSYKEFFRDYVRPKRPVVIKDGVRSDTITNSTLAARYGDRLISDLIGSGGNVGLVRGRASAIEQFSSLKTFNEYLAGVDAGADLPYLTNLSVALNFPEMAEAFKVPAYFESNWMSRWPLSIVNPEGATQLEAFIGPAGTGYGNVHYDLGAVQLGTCQYFGTKLWWFCPPDQSEYLYPVSAREPHISRVDPFEPDYDTFPLFRKAKPYVVTLEPGDVLFIPDSWWHVTRAATATISTLIRFVNQYNVGAHVWGHVRRLTF
jgi:histone arginine demethylase JMJD6